ncbi:PEP-CTERM sorting domain-containing protein [Spirulina subsalsa]|uniref:PEP-CTERM sorting domain-containing protein n=1 Tax=Spirulina subsalsa TaxID=54311 RepID=UPI0002FF32C5|nr:PEP-CTERM sorting domain-containing protein [Spirulina subsalsa]
MKLNPTALISGLAAAGAIAASGMTAQAASFTARDAEAAACANQQVCVVNDFFTLTAGNDMYLTHKSFEGFYGLGIAENPDPNLQWKDDPSWGEIDSNGEFLRVDLAVTKALRSIDLNFLYQPGVNSDRVFEVAEITATLLDGSFLTHTLTVTGDTSASWSGTGSVVNVSPSTAGGGGWYSILNPFGDLEVASLSFAAVRVNDSLTRQSWDSDYTLKGIATVPEPATVLGLVGVAALAGFGVRRRQNSEQ